MKRTLWLLGSLLAAACAAPLACAWAPQGHRTVGAIADRLLTPAAQAEVTRLLADDRDKYGDPSGRTSLEAVANWADELHGTPAAQARWHYDDVPVCGKADKARYCEGGQCNTEQLRRLIAVLGDRGAALRERNEALKWVVHLVGDIHQPLHAADNDDRGGNLVPVVLEGVHTRGRENLHRVWDNDLVRLALQTRSRQQPPRNIDALAQEAKRLVVDGGQGSPDSWASESNNLARNVVYHYPGFSCDAVPGNPVVLDAAYQEEAEALVRERLLLAGARLAALLNQTLTADSTIQRRSP